MGIRFLLFFSASLSRLRTIYSLGTRSVAEALNGERVLIGTAMYSSGMFEVIYLYRAVS